jgi:AmmeMemoRadiSam system protein A
MNDTQKRQLLALARNSVASRFEPLKFDIPDDPEFQRKFGLFVTIHKRGELRGCIGYIKGYRSLAESVAEMARSAAFKDPRFRPVSKEELPELEFEISVLGGMEPVADPSEIVIGRDGLYLEHPYGSGLLLPQVPVEWHWDLKQYLRHICLKAGLHEGAYLDRGAKLSRFGAEVFSEADILVDKSGG